MSRPRAQGVVGFGIVGGLLLIPAPAAIGGEPEVRRPRVAPAQVPLRLDEAILQALAANPATAPYPFTTEVRGGRIILRGRVGTKLIHDTAVQIATAITPS